MESAQLVEGRYYGVGENPLVSIGNRVRVGPLTAEITAPSAKRLQLREGQPVVAAFKATATRVVASHTAS
jgi:molybdopterin-binding protein